MSDLRAYQPAFTAGVLSPSLWGRIDFRAYSTGMKVGENLIIHAHGGASNRPGFEFINEVKDSNTLVRLIPFQFNTEQSYVLEFGPLYMRVYRDGGLVMSGGVPYEIATPWTFGAQMRIVFAQEADVMYLVEGGTAPRKLSRLADDNWLLETILFVPKISPPASITGQANTSGTPTYIYMVLAVYINEGRWSSEVSAQNDIMSSGVSNTIAWNAVAGASSYRVYRRTPSGSYGRIYSGGSLSVVDNGIAAGSSPGVVPPGSEQLPAPKNVRITPNGGNINRYMVSAVSEETGEESLANGPVAIKNDLSIAGNVNTISWSAVAGADRYIIYKEDNGVYGYIGGTSSLRFEDENITPDLADTPQSGRNPFVGAGNFPRCVSFVEQRLAFASSLNDPQAVWMSQSANYENFGYSSPSKASDAVTFRIKARQVNEIRSILPVKAMLLLTSAAEWLVSGGSQSDAITPSAIRIDNQGYRGSSWVQPIVVGNTVLFAQDRGGVVRDFSYEFANDAYTGKDLTILARHLFDNRSIKSWAYAQAPHSIAWVVMDDGSLASLTYMREHEVWGWTSHKSGADAKFEDVVVVSDGVEDVPYFLVRRVVNGVVKRYIERLHTRVMASVNDAFFVDCGLTYSGPPSATMTGLGHLEGQQVVALADGNVVRGLTVTGGAVTLPYAASKAHVGLPMTASLATLDLDLGTVPGLGTVQGRMKSVSEVTLRVEDTRGIWIGNKDGNREDPHLVEYKQRQSEAWNESIQLYTGDISITPSWDWNKSGVTWIKQFDPLPMSILAVMPDVTLGK